MFISGNWYETGSCVNYRKYHHLDHQNCDIIYTNYIFPTYDDTEFIHAFLTDLKLQIRLFYVSQNIYIVYFFQSHFQQQNILTRIKKIGPIWTKIIYRPP